MRRFDPEDFKEGNATLYRHRAWELWLLPEEWYCVACLAFIGDYLDMIPSEYHHPEREQNLAGLKHWALRWVVEECEYEFQGLKVDGEDIFLLTDDPLDEPEVLQPVRGKGGFWKYVDAKGDPLWWAEMGILAESPARLPSHSPQPVFDAQGVLVPDEEGNPTFVLDESGKPVMLPTLGYFAPPPYHKLAEQSIRWANVEFPHSADFIELMETLIGEAKRLLGEVRTTTEALVGTMKAGAVNN